MLMRKQSDYWSAWMAGWASAARTIFQTQQRALEMLLPRRPPLEIAHPATAGDKPAPRRRVPRAQRRRRAPSARSAAEGVALLTPDAPASASGLNTFLNGLDTRGARGR